MSLTSSLELSKGKMSGSIDIIMGCMFSGKSTELIRLANRYKVLEMNVLTVNRWFLINVIMIQQLLHISQIKRIVYLFKSYKK